jgi:hypothetical protein
MKAEGESCPQAAHLYFFGCRETSTNDAPAEVVVLGNELIRKGSFLSLDGHSGRIYPGEMKVIVERPVAYLETLKS